MLGTNKYAYAALEQVYMCMIYTVIRISTTDLCFPQGSGWNQLESPMLPATQASTISMEGMLRRTRKPCTPRVEAQGKEAMDYSMVPRARKPWITPWSPGSEAQR